jgi:hypothetical protein
MGEGWEIATISTGTILSGIVDVSPARPVSLEYFLRHNLDAAGTAGDGGSGTAYYDGNVNAVTTRGGDGGSGGASPA